MLQSLSTRGRPANFLLGTHMCEIAHLIDLTWFGGERSLWSFFPVNKPCNYLGLSRTWLNYRIVYCVFSVSDAPRAASVEISCQSSKTQTVFWSSRNIFRLPYSDADSHPQASCFLLLWIINISRHSKKERKKDSIVSLKQSWRCSFEQILVTQEEKLFVWDCFQLLICCCCEYL